MDLTPSDDQEAMRAATEHWLTANLPLDWRHLPSEPLWQGIEEMGWLSLGRDGIDYATEALLVAELGRFLAPVAILSTVVARRWSDQQGKTALAVGSRVLDAEHAQGALGLFDDCIGHHAIINPRVHEGLDPTAPTAKRGDITPTLIDDRDAVLHLQLVAAAYALGCAEAAAQMATGYAKLREQFGRPIGSFQAIKHMCADMVVRTMVARSQLLFAACSLDAGGGDRVFHVAAARRLADQAAMINAQGNIQVHGGIGTTDEAQAHLPLKRAHLLRFVAPAAMADLLPA